MLAASVVGISIGCLLGMLPLLFMSSELSTADQVFGTLDLDGSGRFVYPRSCVHTSLVTWIIHLGCLFELVTKCCILALFD